MDATVFSYNKIRTSSYSILPLAPDLDGEFPDRVVVNEYGESSPTLTRHVAIILESVFPEAFLHPVLCNTRAAKNTLEHKE